MKPIRLLPFSLEKIFPFNNLTGEESDDAQKVNEAYKKLFVELIPGFVENRVQFVLAEVLEIDRKDSTSRLLVYSELKDEERSNLIKEYRSIIENLKSETNLLISESDAFYITSRIWCAETKGIEPSSTDETEKEWSFLLGEKLTKTGVALDPKIDIKSEEAKIDAAFRVYVEKLYSHYLSNFPFAYVILVPVFLGSMYGRIESLQKLGAVFLHFTTTKRVKQIDLRRIYGRTLLFWHYYFTSEAIDKRQSQLEESIRAKESLEISLDLYSRSERLIDKIREGLQGVQEPISELEKLMAPKKGIIFKGVDLSDFFESGGHDVLLAGGRIKITPKHGWQGEADIEIFKKLIAGILIKVAYLENESIAERKDLWTQVTAIINRKADNKSQPLFDALLNNIPHLREKSPSNEQVKETFKLIKSWFSDAYKSTKPTRGLPVTMLEFALEFWGCNEKSLNSGTKMFWVGSEVPVQTIDALGMLNAEYKIRETKISATRASKVTTCEMSITLGESHKKGELKNLIAEYDSALEGSTLPRGSMTKFLWHLTGRRKLNLHDTILSWKDGNCELSINFADATGQGKEMVIMWKGEIKTS